MKNSGLAVILSFFIVGLGQIYNGQIGKGLFMLVVYYILVVLAWSSIASISFGNGGLITAGLIAVPVVFVIWIIGMVDAYKSAEKINKNFNKKE